MPFPFTNLSEPKGDQVMNMDHPDGMLFTVADQQLGYAIGFKDIKALLGHGGG